MRCSQANTARGKKNKGLRPTIDSSSVGARGGGGSDSALVSLGLLSVEKQAILQTRNFTRYICTSLANSLLPPKRSERVHASLCIA